MYCTATRLDLRNHLGHRLLVPRGDVPVAQGDGCHLLQQAQVFKR
jgi:hypothetical protein